MADKKVEFGTKLGLVAATVGSAVGLGNIWRFPAETQANGGGAFLIVYFFCVLLLGIPVMLGEMAIGREGGSDAVSDYKKIAPRTRWWLIGALGLLTAYLILMFYSVVAGWTLEYLVNSVSGNLFAGLGSATDAGADSFFIGKMEEYTGGGWMPTVFTMAVVAMNIGIVVFGVKNGIERMANIMMPMLFLILLIFCGYVATLPGAGDGLKYFLMPEFGKITPKVVINALGQAFFSLSLGMAALITYAGYYPKSTKLIGTATTVSLLDMLVSVIMGMIIFPALASFGMLGHTTVSGTTLVFVTLPEVFQQMPGTWFWAVLFFTLLLVAALTSTISLAEVATRFVQDRFGIARVKAVLLVMVPVFFFSAVCSLSCGPWADATVFGYTIFGLLDALTSNIFLPFGSLLMCIYLGWFAPKSLMRRQLTNDGTLRSHFVGVILFLIRWVAPVAIAAILISPLL